MTVRRILGSAALLVLLLGASPLPAQQPTPAPPPAMPTFAVVFRTGPKWDAAKPPNEQAFFREHSENLRALRAEGKIAIGGRYAEVGLLLVTASSEAEARGLFEKDPSVNNGTFVFELHEFRPFFPGCVGKTSSTH
jgi:hypothetical protein